jgi:tetratricopeptide (TPR) repeat protein
LTELRRLDDALATYNKAIALKPDVMPAYWNKSSVLLLMGQFEQGWRLYEYRKKLAEPIAAQIYPQPAWLGEEEIEGKRLFIHSEQGMGDVIQFCRYALLAEGRGANVFLSAPAALARLLKSLSPTIQIAESGFIPAKFDFHVPLLSMPMAFKTEGNNMPSDVPYLRAEPDQVRKWEKKIGNSGFKVGICWQGSKIGAAQGKSFPLAEFRRICAIRDVRLISLQKGDGTEQLRDLPLGMEVEELGDDFDAGRDAFVDTAAVMESLDLIITADTSIAHLAGALGRPAWVILKYVPDWRWFLDRSDSPWYPTLKLFRQNSYDNWSDAFGEVEAQLSELIGMVSPTSRVW